MPPSTAVPPERPEARDEMPPSTVPPESREAHRTERAPRAVQQQERVLENGLRVVLRHDPAASDAALCVAYRVGSADDPPNRRGLAHFTEHLMFAPSASAPNGAGAFYESAGATYVNAATTDIATRYCAAFPQESLRAALFVESDRMAFRLSELNEAQIQNERPILLNEALQRGELATRRDSFDWQELFSELPRAAAYDEDGEDIDDITLSDVQAFFRTYYGPANASLALVTSRTPDEVWPEIERCFAHVEGAPAPPRRPSPPVTLPGEVELTFLSTLNSTRLAITWAVPPTGAPLGAELDLAASHLRRRLVRWAEGQPLVRSVAAAYVRDPEQGAFRIVIAGDGDADLNAAERLLSLELSALHRRPLRSEDFQAARRSAILRAITSPLGWAVHLAMANLYDRPRETDSRAYYRAATPESLHRAVGRLLPMGRRIIFRALPDTGPDPSSSGDLSRRIRYE
ncbi:MAG: insulinase family protein [Myxococcota bacterium]